MHKPITHTIAAFTMPWLLLAGCSDGDVAVSDTTQASGDPGASNDASDVDPVLPCWQTETTLNMISASVAAVDVADDGAVLVANRDVDSRAQLDWYSASGEPEGTFSVPGVLQTLHAMPGKNAVVGWSVGAEFAASSGSAEPDPSTYVLAKMDADGTAVWSDVLPGRVRGGGRDFNADMRADYAFDVGPDDTVTLMGAFSNTVLIGAGSENETTLDAGDGGIASFVARYAADGTLLYAKKLDSVFLPSSIAVAADGSTYAFGDDRIGIYPSTQLVAFDEDGELLWRDVAEVSPNLLFGPDDDFSSHMAIAEDGSLAISGTFLGELVFPDGHGLATKLSAQIVDAGGGAYKMFTSHFLARYSTAGEQLLVKGGYDGEVAPWCTETGGCQLAKTFFRENRFLITGALQGERVFGNGEPGETVLSNEISPWFIAQYNLDGTLESAEYIDVPEDTENMTIAGTAADHFIGVTDNFYPADPADPVDPDAANRTQTVLQYCL